MAEIVLGIGTSHSPMFALEPEVWETYSSADRGIPELAMPPDGKVLSFAEAARRAPAEIRDKPRDLETYRGYYNACQTALDVIAKTLLDADPDVTLIISDDQDEWYYDNNMPSIAVYWGDTVRLIPQTRLVVPGWTPEIPAAISRGYGDVEMDIPVASGLGRFLVDYLIDHDFDVAQANYVEHELGGSVGRRYPTEDGGELDFVRQTKTRRQGLPHGFSFITKRFYDNAPRTILPIVQNTCYPPNQVRPSRAYNLGRAIADAVSKFPEDLRVAVVGSGGLSHFVVDEELDRKVLTALAEKDADTLTSLPRERLFSGTSETLNWITVGGVMESSPLQMELIDYVPVYRSEAGTGGGWAFARWQ